MEHVMEYVAAIWDPCQQYIIDKIESVPRKARYVCNSQNNSESVSDMLREINWTPLRNRRELARLSIM
jgi:hypothetical protein